jgi:hypothetical protein
MAVDVSATGMPGMPVEAVRVPLGCIGPAASWSGLGPRGWLMHHPGLGVVVMPQTRLRDGWRCEIIAGPPTFDGRRVNHVWLGEDQVDALPTALLLGWVADCEQFALLWQVRVRQRFHAGPVPAVARVLAEQLRRADELSICLGPAGLRRLGIAAHLRSPGLRAALGRLVRAGMLTLHPPTPESSTVDGGVVVGLVLGAAWAGLPQRRPPLVEAVKT